MLSWIIDLSTLMSFVPEPHLHIWHLFTPLVFMSGRKKHATEFHQNPNYVMTFELKWLLSYMVSNNKIVVPYMETSWLWICIPGSCKFHAPSPTLAAHELLLVLSLNYACLSFTGQSMEETLLYDLGDWIPRGNKC